MTKTMMMAFFLVGALCFGAQAQLNLSGMMDAGMDAAKAVTLTDEEVKTLALSVREKSDASNPVAKPSSLHAQRLARLIKDMKVENAPKLDIKIYMVKDVNAFAIADGTIRVFAGLMDLMADDEIRYVIGHEIGHVVLGHTKNALQVAYASSAARKAGAATGATGIATLSDSSLGELTEKLVNSQFSQSQENEADQYALKFMKYNKYDPKAAVSALRKIEKQYGNKSSLFSSHPAPGERATTLEKSL
jgi:putative metalloprotease